MAIGHIDDAISPPYDLIKRKWGIFNFVDNQGYSPILDRFCKAECPRGTAVGDKCVCGVEQVAVFCLAELTIHLLDYQGCRTRQIIRYVELEDRH